MPKRVSSSIHLLNWDLVENVLVHVVGDAGVCLTQMQQLVGGGRLDVAA